MAVAVVDNHKSRIHVLSWIRGKSTAHLISVSATTKPGAQFQASTSPASISVYVKHARTARISSASAHTQNLSAFFYIRNTPNLVSGIGCSVAAARAKPSASRVSCGSITPSSQSRAEE